jgi:hypothetical protein
MRIATIRKVIGVTGIAALGAALAYAPIAAFRDDMLVVTKAGIAGVVLVIVARLIPRDGEGSVEPTPDDER